MFLPNFSLSFQCVMLLSHNLKNGAIALKGKTEKPGGVAIGEER